MRRSRRRWAGAASALALLLALSACTDPEKRCAEAASIYDGLEQRGAAEVGLTFVACVR